MVCACIDIGSNTTRLLVADVRDGGLRPLHQRRAFTRIGAEVAAGGRVGAAKMSEVAGVVAEYRAVAAQTGARRLRVVATAGVRAAANQEELLSALTSVAGTEVDVLGGDDEARLAFAGATRTFARPLDGIVGVVDVGGGSTEIAVGTVAGGVTWCRSLPVGSGVLTDAQPLSDPPSTEEIERMRAQAEKAMAGLTVPGVDAAVAVGGSAASLRLVVGAQLDRDGMRRAVRRLTEAPAEELSRRFNLDPQRMKLLPAGILVLDTASHRLGRPLQLASGGVREGVCLQLAAAGDHPPA